MAAEIKKGDVVVLNSGGPDMTVQNIGDYGEIKQGAKCVWFDKSKRYEDVFDVEMLSLSEDDEL